MFRWGATVIACLGLATMTGCGLGIEGESPEVSFKSKAEERGAEGETHSGKPGGPSGSGDHETGAQLSGDTLKSSDEGTGGGGSSSGEQATTAREGNTETTGVLPKPGPFDPTAPGFELFDPCSEIPDWMLVKAGIGELLETGNDQNCSFAGTGSDAEFRIIGLSASKSSLSELKESRETRAVDLGEFSQPLVAFQGIFGDMFCTVSGETQRGTITVSLYDQRIQNENDLCKGAAKVLQSLSE